MIFINRGSILEADKDDNQNKNNQNDDEHDIEEQPSADYGVEDDSIDDSGNSKQETEDTTDNQNDDEHDTEEQPSADYNSDDNEDNNEQETEDTTNNQNDESSDYNIDDEVQQDNIDDTQDDVPANYDANDDSGDQQDNTEDNNSEDNIDNNENNQSTQDSELSSVDEDIMSGLSDEQKALKSIELKNRYLELYNTTELIIQRIDTISRSKDNIKILYFLIQKLQELKKNSYDYIIDVYDTKSFIENIVQYQQYLAVLNTVNQVLIELNPNKDDDNKNENN